MAERLLVERAEKVYPGGAVALKGPSFTVEPGTFMVLLGPSGSGKTTMLRAVAGIEKLTSGRIAIGDTTVADDGTHVPPERRGLAMVFQDYALWPHLCVRDNVAFALRRRRLAREHARARALAMLERVGLGRYGERFPSQLSGGEQQRVALARALVGGAGLLLCDEPLSNLDADLRERMRVEIASLVREAGATTVYITHDQHEAFALADLVGVLEDGRLVQIGAAEDIYAAPASLFVARFTGLAGELEAQVLSSGRSGHGEAAPLAFRARRPIQAKMAPGAAGARTGVLAIRPAAVRLCAPEADDAHVVGSVADTAFRGRHYELVVDLPAGKRFTGVISERRVPRGTAVGLQLDASGTILFSDTARTDAPGSRAPDGAAEPVPAPSAPTGTAVPYDHEEMTTTTRRPHG